MGKRKGCMRNQVPMHTDATDITRAMSDPRNERYTIQDRILAVLECSPDGATSAELMERLDYPGSTVPAAVMRLREKGCVVEASGSSRVNPSNGRPLAVWRAKP